MKKALGSFSKNIKEKAIRTASDFSDTKSLISLDIPVLNILASGRIDGGISENQMCYLATPKAMGKTTVIFKFLAKGQKEGKLPIYIETENRFNKELARKCGLNVDEMIIIETKIIEDIQASIAQLYKDFTFDEIKDTIIGFDSWGAMISSKDVSNSEEEDVEKRNMYFNQQRKKLAVFLTSYKSSKLVAGWTYENIGSMGNMKAISGGSGMEYMPDVVLQGTSESKSDKSVKKTSQADDKNSNIDGKVITFKTMKSSAGGMEDTTLKVRVLKDIGIDPFWGLLDDALICNVVSKEGNRYVNNVIGDGVKMWEKDIYNEEFWKPIWNDETFKNHITKRYSYNEKDMKIATFDLASVITD